MKGGFNRVKWSFASKGKKPCHEKHIKLNSLWVFCSIVHLFCTWVCLALPCLLSLRQLPAWYRLLTTLRLGRDMDNWFYGGGEMEKQRRKEEVVFSKSFYSIVSLPSSFRWGVCSARQTRMVTGSWVLRSGDSCLDSQGWRQLSRELFHKLWNVHGFI